MPTPKPGENRKQFLSHCVPMLIHEGKKQDQAVAICYSLFNRRRDLPDNPDDPDGYGGQPPT